MFTLLTPFKYINILAAIYTYLFIYLFVSFIHPFVYLIIHSLTVCFVYLLIYLFVCLFIYLFLLEIINALAIVLRRRDLNAIIHPLRWLWL